MVFTSPSLDTFRCETRSAYHSAPPAQALVLLGILHVAVGKLPAAG